MDNATVNNATVTSVTVANLTKCRLITKPNTNVGVPF